MRFGIATLGDAPLASIAQRAQLLEELGFDQLWMADERLMRNVYACLAVAALNTARIGLGTAVTNPYTRNSAITAAAIATVDEASGGRAVLGLGAGGGLDSYGIHREHPAAALEEMVRIVRSLTAGETVSFQGSVLTMAEAELNFRPWRRIPIYLAGRGPRILELAGKLADGAIIGGFTKPAGLAYAMSRLEAGLDSSRRSRSDLEVVSWVYTSIHDDPETARDAVRGLIFTSLITSRPILDQIGVVLPKALREHLEVSRWRITQDSVAVGKQLLSEEILDAFSVTGTPQQCIAKLIEIARAGVDQIAMVPLCPDGVALEKMVRRLAADVLPGIAPESPSPSLG